jgi:hypothetical protein
MARCLVAQTYARLARKERQPGGSPLLVLQWLMEAFVVLSTLIRIGTDCKKF